MYLHLVVFKFEGFVSIMKEWGTGRRVGAGGGAVGLRESVVASVDSALLSCRERPHSH